MVLHTHERTLDWRAGIRVAVLAVALGIAVPGAAAANEAPDEDAAMAEAEQADRAGVGDEGAEHERSQQTDAGDGAPVVMIEPESPQSEMVCRSMRVTGSRIPQRVCMTAERWEESDSSRRADGQRFLHDVQRQSGLAPGASAESRSAFDPPSSVTNPAGN
jgi:hypothetical protein